MPAGGKRPNSGRPKGKKAQKTMEVEAAKELIRNMVFKDLQPIVEAQRDLAMGVRVMSEDGRVYSKPPDKGAAELLFNHSIGKPKESLEVLGEVKIDIDIKKTIDKVYGENRESN